MSHDEPRFLSDARDTIGNKFWRMQNLYRIRDKNKNLTLLKFNKIQQSIVKAIETSLDRNGNIKKPVREFDLKFRQGGVSTFWELFWLDDTIFSENTVTGILADKKENLNYLFEIVRLAHANMPSTLQPKLGEDSRSALSFPGTNSKIFVSLSIKATALHNLHISEVAYCEDIEIQRTLGACSPTSNISMETTGNGVGNYAYELYQDAKKQESEYRGNFFAWPIQEEYRIPLNGMTPEHVISTYTGEERKFIDLMERIYGLKIGPEQILFRRLKQKELRGLYRQEFPETDEDAFLSSGNKFFDPRKIHRLMMGSKQIESQNQPFAIDPNGDWIQWETPQKKHIYAAGADTSEGGHDYSYLKIINVTKKREAFRFRARCGVDYFYKQCDKWGRLYNRALLGVERNNHGHAVLLGLDEDCHYPNLFHQDKPQPVVGHVDKPSKTGWTTDRNTKPLMLDELKCAIEGDWDQDEDHFSPEIFILDRIFLSECLTFEQEGGKLEAIAGKYDDGIIATAIAYQMYKRQNRYAVPDKGGKPFGVLYGDTGEINSAF